MGLDGDEWWWMVCSRICFSRWAGSSLQWSWSMVGLLLMLRFELALRPRIPRSLPPCLICVLEVSVKLRVGGWTLSLAAQVQPAVAGSWTMGRLWAGFILSTLWGTWWGEGHVHRGRFRSSRGYWSYSLQEPFGFGSRESLAWAGLLFLPPQSHPGQNTHFDPSGHSLWVFRQTLGGHSSCGGKCTPRSSPLAL